MAMVRMQPIRVEVRTNWFTGTPREIVLDGRRIHVKRIAAVRREVSAFPVATGPRTVFEVVTHGATLALTFKHRSRRWEIDGYDGPVPFAFAA
ncbi:MAG: hypothetical protein WCH74_09205 [Chloroflexota bacterium]